MEKYREIRLPKIDLSQVKPGDKLLRMLAGSIPMVVVVGEVKDGIIFTGSIDGVVPSKDGWTFDQETGMELDIMFPDSVVSFIKEVIKE